MAVKLSISSRIRGESKTQYRPINPLRSTLIALMRQHIRTRKRVKDYKTPNQMSIKLEVFKAIFKDKSNLTYCFKPVLFHFCCILDSCSLHNFFETQLYFHFPSVRPKVDFLLRDALQYQIVCFFNIVQTAFDPLPPLVFEHLCCGLYRRY